MFGTECEGTCSTSGTAEVEGSTIYWVKDTTTEIITLTITQFRWHNNYNVCVNRRL